MFSIVSLTTANRPAQLHESGDSCAHPNLDALFRRSYVRRVDVKEHVFVAGDPRFYLYRIERGALCLYKLATNGRRQIVRFLFAGDLFGFGFEKDHHLCAQALQSTWLHHIPLNALSVMCGIHPTLAERLNHVLLKELNTLQDQLLAIGQKTALERVAFFLLGISHRRVGEDMNTLSLAMTRQDMGDFLGLTLETVSRALTKLRSQRLIDFKQASEIILLDRKKLEELADTNR
jgi:CRP/FNR family transcriptional regulator